MQGNVNRSKVKKKSKPDSFNRRRALKEPGGGGPTNLALHALESFQERGERLKRSSERRHDIRELAETYKITDPRDLGNLEIGYNLFGVGRPLSGPRLDKILGLVNSRRAERELTENVNDTIRRVDKLTKPSKPKKSLPQTTSRRNFPVR